MEPWHIYGDFNLIEVTVTARVLPVSLNSQTVSKKLTIRKRENPLRESSSIWAFIFYYTGFS